MLQDGDHSICKNGSNFRNDSTIDKEMEHAGKYKMKL